MTRPYTVAFRCSLALSLAVAFFWTAWLIIIGPVPQDELLGLTISRWWTILIGVGFVCLWVYAEVRFKKKTKPTTHEWMNNVILTPSVLGAGFIYSMMSSRLFLVFLITAVVFTSVVNLAFRVWALIGPWLLAEK